MDIRNRTFLILGGTRSSAAARALIPKSRRRWSQYCLEIWVVCVSWVGARTPCIRPSDGWLIPKARIWGREPRLEAPRDARSIRGAFLRTKDRDPWEDSRIRWGWKTETGHRKGKDGPDSSAPGEGKGWAASDRLVVDACRQAAGWESENLGLTCRI